jgi:hypothetical protein
MPKRLTCQHPDRDVPALKCGYPLPCPHHTLVLEPCPKRKLSKREQKCLRDRAHKAIGKSKQRLP